MADLKPTPARLELLRAAERGDLHGSYDGHMVFTAYRRINGNDYGQTVNRKQFNDMKTAGWVRFGRALGASYYSRRPIELTDAGRAVLAAADTKEQ